MSAWGQSRAAARTAYGSNGLKADDRAPARCAISCRKQYRKNALALRPLPEKPDMAIDRVPR
jgi:hypothetical protein